MRGTTCGTALALLLTASGARAQYVSPYDGRPTNVDPRDDALPNAPPFAKRVHLVLDYQGPPGCAEGGLFEDAMRVVEPRWNVWAPIVPWHLKIRLTPNASGRGYDGEGWLNDRAGVERWHNPWFRGLPCYRVVSGLATEVHGAILEVSLHRASPRAEAAPCPAATPCDGPSRQDVGWFKDGLLAPRGEPDPASPPERWPIAIRLGIAVRPELVAEGWTSFGFAADAGLRFRLGSVNVEAHGNPAYGALPRLTGSLSFARVTGRLVPCVHLAGWFAGCLLGDVGRVFFPQRFKLMPASTFYGALGVRAGVEKAVVERYVFFRFGVEVLAPIRPSPFVFMGQTAFALSRPNAGLGVGFLGEIPAL